jgi:hypothetical protein
VAAVVETGEGGGGEQREKKQAHCTSPFWLLLGDAVTMAARMACGPTAPAAAGCGEGADSTAATSAGEVSIMFAAAQRPCSCLDGRPAVMAGSISGTQLNFFFNQAYTIQSATLSTQHYFLLSYMQKSLPLAPQPTVLPFSRCVEFTSNTSAGAMHLPPTLVFHHTHSLD